MPDITMCINPKGCLLKLICYRNTAIPSEYQSWANFNAGDGSVCKDFLPLKEVGK